MKGAVAVHHLPLGNLVPTFQVIGSFPCDDASPQPPFNPPASSLLTNVYLLTASGAERSVRHKDVDEYCSRLAQLRASEYLPQAAAFRSGLEEALPRSALSLLTWRDMEGLILGGGGIGLGCTIGCLNESERMELQGHYGC